MLIGRFPSRSWLLARRRGAGVRPPNSAVTREAGSSPARARPTACPAGARAGRHVDRARGPGRRVRAQVRGASGVGVARPLPPPTRVPANRARAPSSRRIPAAVGDVTATTVGALRSCPLQPAGGPENLTELPGPDIQDRPRGPRPCHERVRHIPWPGQHLVGAFDQHPAASTSCPPRPRFGPARPSTRRPARRR